jgi:hypothetical protein
LYSFGAGGKVPVGVINDPREREVTWNTRCFRQG